MNQFNEILESVLAGVPNFIIAILLAILAWIVAAIVRKIIVKLGKKLKLPARFAKLHIVKDEEKGKDLLKTFGSLGFLITFLVMIPGVFDRLGMNSVSMPITTMVSSALEYLPNILGALLVLFIGYLLSKIAREVVAGLTKAAGVDKLANRINSESDKEYLISELLGTIVFALIIIPTVIMALQILQLDAVANPAIEMLSSIFAVIPNIVVCVIMLMLGLFIAKIVGQIVKGFFVNTGIDKIADHKHFSVLFSKYKPSVMFTSIIKVIIIAIFVFQAVSVLNLAVLTDVSNAILIYTPNVIAALLILLIAYFAATYVSAFVKNISGSKLIATVTTVLIYVFAIFMTLNQLKIAQDIVMIAFIVIAGSVALAFVIAFGIGGKEFAKKQLEKIDKKLDE